MIAPFRVASLFAVLGGMALSAPAVAVPGAQATVQIASHAAQGPVYGDMVYRDHDRGRHRGWDRRWQQRGWEGRGRGYERGDDYRQYRRYPAPAYPQRTAYDRYPANYGEPANYNTRVWQGRDGRYYCRKSDGTTGLLIGGAVGALLGREVAGRGDRTLGAILGAAGGALLGRTVDNRSRCR